MNAEETRIGKTEAIRVNVDQETKSELERKAAEQDVSVAHLIRQGIKTVLAASIVALLLAPSAAAHIPFKDGRGSARALERMLNRSPDFTEISCHYRAAHVRCNGYSRWGRSDAYMATMITVHKTAARKGLAFVCITRLGICRRQIVELSR